MIFFVGNQSHIRTKKINLAQSIKRLIKFWDFNLDLVIGPYPGGWITEALTGWAHGVTRVGLVCGAPYWEPTGALEGSKGPAAIAS